jgi:alkanesulfonate monooxygenase SsuD/methylene tetrahydromethanopterin reductase-like flavin-dependent oxidoreductase (luciferase family)
MPNTAAPLKFGADIWNQYVDWSTFKAAHQLADQLGYDSLWTMDHIYPPFEPSDGPILEPYMAMAPIAELTRNATIGVMVSANTYRNPALLTKMVTTLDHVSNGRAILGVGSAWSESEHRGFGFEFGDSPGERLRWLKEALPVIRGMLDGTRPRAAGDRYHMVEVANSPAPVQARLPLLIGGSGPKVTLRLVAEYADICNIGGTPEEVARKDAILVEHCEAIGRDEKTIERSIDIGVPTIRESREDARQANDELFHLQGNMKPWPQQPVGTVDEVYDSLARYVDVGYRHFIFYLPAPYDVQTITRLITDVRPRLQTLIDA